MLSIGQEVRSVSGKRFQLLAEIGQGGQGACYLAEDNTADKYVVKSFNPRFCNDATRSRLAYLVKLSLTSVAEVICAPIDWIDDNGVVGHISEYFEAANQLMELLETPIPLMECIEAAIQIAHAFAVLHENGIAHGDPHDGNVLARREGQVWRVKLIDNDNYAAPGVALPSCLGHTDYLAPELRKGSQRIPSIATDQYAIAVMMHTLLLRKFPFDAFSNSLLERDQVAALGYWPFDPMRYQHQPTTGYPVEILNPALMSLFRRGLSDQPHIRPTALEWRDYLVDALSKVIICPNCGGPQILDNSKAITGCCLCQRPFPILQLAGSFGTIPLEKSATVLTRELLGGDKSVSTRHAIIHRYGPEYRIHDENSRNGVWKIGTNGWIRLTTGLEPNRQPLLVLGDKIRFGSVTCVVANF